MEIRRAADVLLRTQTTALPSLLNPVSTSRWTARSKGARLVRRSLTSSATYRALKPQPTTFASPSITNSSQNPSKSVDDLSKSLWAGRPKKPAPRLDPEREKRMNGGSSAADLLAAMRAAGGFNSSSFDSSRMLNPLGTNDNKSMMNDMALGTLSIPQKPRIPMRLTPSTGRSIAIGSGIDVARGLRLLEQSCARNRVRADFTSQRFHERGGLKRKRLRRQRWRRKFMEGFKATVGRVKQLKHQGW